MFGQMGAALLGSAVGRAGGPLMERMVSPEEKARADRFVQRWGALAIVVSRPIPLFAETVAILAGASRVPWLRVALAAAAGSLPPALLYALTGAVADDFQSAALMFGFVILMTAVTWAIGTRLGKQASGD
jgi:membrane protein DedA with SNARE-associated domain